MKNKKDIKSDHEKMRLPQKENNELFAIATQLLGGSRIQINCADGKKRLARIPGKMRRSARVRTGDLLIIVPWQFQADKADIIYRYTQTQSKQLKSTPLIPEALND